MPQICLYLYHQIYIQFFDYYMSKEATTKNQNILISELIKKLEKTVLDFLFEKKAGNLKEEYFVILRNAVTKHAGITINYLAKCILHLDTEEFLNEAEQIFKSYSEDAKSELGIKFYSTQWISVTCRLPFDDRNVVTFSKFHNPKMQIGFYCKYSKKWLITDDKEISHWLPLPIAPKLYNHNE